MTNIPRLFMQLVSFVLTNAPIKMTEPDAETLKALFSFAKKHEMAHLAAEGLMRAGLMPEGELGEAFKRQRMAAIFSDQSKTRTLDHLGNILAENQITYIPLKGSVLREYYPETWMRTRSDIDVLVHPEDFEKAKNALVDAGYKTGAVGGCDLAFQSPKDVHIELHHALLYHRGKINTAHLEGVWEHAVPAEGYEYRYTMSEAMFYGYNVSHFAKHARTGGCGLRFFVDLWLLDRLEKADTEGRRAILEQGGLLKFAETAGRLADCWMEDAPVTDPVLQRFESFVISGGVYGGFEQYSSNIDGSPAKELFLKIFTPYHIMLRFYPKLKKYPILYPLCLCHRWLGFIKRKKVGAKFATWKKESEVYKDKQADTHGLMKDIGLM